MAGFVKVAQTEEVVPGRGTLVEVNGRKIALFQVDGAYHAIDDACPHQGGPLSEGDLAGTEVTCPWHGAIFDVTTGAVLGPPATKGVTRHRVRVSGTSIEIEV